MNLSSIVLIGIFAALILLVIRLWLNKLEEKTKLSDELVEWLKSSTSQIDNKLNENMKMFNTRLDNAARVIGDVQRTIGEFSEIGRSMQELQEFLSSPKLRGNIGEHILKELLSQHFPQGSFKLQHTFKNGEKVDAVIITTQGLIPIDSKFPMENFRKLSKEKDKSAKERVKKDFISDVKKHIQAISKKYILVGEGTLDYALMYIPSESIYYEIINEADLFDFASKQRILPVSPMSFYAYIKAVLMSFEGQKIQSKAKEILEVLRAIKKDYEKTDESLTILTKHFTNAYNQLSQVSKSFLTLGQKLSSTNLISSASTEQQKLIE